MSCYKISIIFYNKTTIKAPESKTTNIKVLITLIHIIVIMDLIQILYNIL